MATRSIMKLLKIANSLKHTVLVAGSSKQSLRYKTSKNVGHFSPTKKGGPSLEDIQSGKWFPRHIADLDYNCNNIIMYDPGTPKSLEAEHPSFKDRDYRQRREEFWHISNEYKQGTPIPRIKYNDDEIKTWKIVYHDLKELHNKVACKDFLNNFKLLEENCGYSEDNIPQLEDISQYLKKKSGFTLRPCGGYLNPRDYLAALAFRVFTCTQYMRHPAFPHYTPEPDMVHEVIGHMPMFVDTEFAQFSQEIGLASLGATDKECNALIRLYFFTIEFGLSTEGEDFDNEKRNLKVYGAGLLSCFDELKFCVTKKANIMPFETSAVIAMEPQVTTFQKGYFYTKNISEALHKLRTYSSNLEKPRPLRYNPHTETVEDLNTLQTVKIAINDLQYQVNCLSNALRQM